MIRRNVVLNLIDFRPYKGTTPKLKEGMDFRVDSLRNTTRWQIGDFLTLNDVDLIITDNHIEVTIRKPGAVDWQQLPNGN